MEHVRAVPHTTSFVETLRHLSEEAILVDIFLRSYPLDFELPKDLHDKTRCVRIIQVSEDCLAERPPQLTQKRKGLEK